MTIMKLTKNNLKLMAFALVTSFSLAFISCGGDDEEDNTNPAPEQPTTTYSPVGVWESGNYFLSLSSDNFLTAYFAERFLDCGNYTISDDMITCNNTYYARPTQYKIKSISATQLQVEISYVDVYGDNQSYYVCN